MSIRGSCACGNIRLSWDVVECACVPRACQCDYCLPRSAAYVTKANTRVEVAIADASSHRVAQHGANLADFHECAACGDVVIATVCIDGTRYGAINSGILSGVELPHAVAKNFSSQSAEKKLQRWRETWCSPVLISGQA